MIIGADGHCKLRNGGHCQTCRNDAGWRNRVDAPDACPEGFTVDSFPQTAQSITGSGTELKRILSSLGIDEREGCGCSSLAARMNRWGVDGCEARMAQIVHHLALQAELRQWMRFVPFKELGVEGLVRLAIMNARNSQRKAVEA